MKRSKNYRELVAKHGLRKDKTYTLDEASNFIKETSLTKFDSSIEVHAKINYKSLQNVRGNIQLPHGTGKVLRIAVFAKGEQQMQAKEAGADVVGDMDLIDKVKDGFLEFDVAVATPEMMKDVGKLGPILGRRGLMPKPKAGTVTNDVKKAIDELRAGKLEYKADKTGVVHLGVGKASFEPNKINDNVKAFFQGLMKDKPSDAKGEYVTSVYVTTTMGPSLKLNHKAIQV